MGFNPPYGAGEVPRSNGIIVPRVKRMEALRAVSRIADSSASKATAPILSSQVRKAPPVFVSARPLQQMLVTAKIIEISVSTMLEDYRLVMAMAEYLYLRSSTGVELVVRNTRVSKFWCLSFAC